MMLLGRGKTFTMNMLSRERCMMVRSLATTRAEGMRTYKLKRNHPEELLIMCRRKRISSFC